MGITTSYFAMGKNLDGTKISIARFHMPHVHSSLDEILSSFAPSVELLRDYKNGKIEWGEYCTRYRAEQRDHYREAPQDFENLLKRAETENIALLCYERFEGPKTKCHRILLYEMLQKVAADKGINVKFCDETQYIREDSKKK